LVDLFELYDDAQTCKLYTLNISACFATVISVYDRNTGKVKQLSKLRK